MKSTNNKQQKNEIAKRSGEQERGIFDPFFDDFFGFPAFPTFPHHEFRQMAHTMKTDIKETDKAYELEIEMPGYKKEDINMTFENGHLNISATKHEKTSQKGENGSFVRKEQSNSCSRSFYVGDVNKDAIDAKLEHGILNVFIPKKQKGTKPNNKIDIK